MRGSTRLTRERVYVHATPAHANREDITAETLNSLKSGEGYALQLRSGEVSKLLRASKTEEIYKKHGIQFGQ